MLSLQKPLNQKEFYRLRARIMQIMLDLPDSLQISEADLRTELAISLFQQERITLGTASQLAGLHQIEFQQLIASRGICIHYDIEDLEQDLKSLREEGW
jgi:predicted HTH domain antitoxin